MIPASTSLRSALAALAALCVLALAPGTAAADLYPVDFCKVWGPDRADSPAATLGVSGFGPIASLDNDCGAGGIGAGLHVVVGGATVAFNEHVGLRVTIPDDRPNLRIARLMTAYYLHPTTSGSSLAFMELRAGATRLDSQAAPIAKVDDRTLPSGTRDVSWSVFCSTSASTSCYWNEVTILDMWKSRLYLDEATDPTFTVAGGTLLAAGAKSGSQSLAFDARDVDSGVSSVSVALGTTVVGSVQYSCAYDDWSACQRDRTSQVLPVDTTKVPDGNHELTVTVTDAANNTLTRSLGTIAVANASAAAIIGAPNGTTASRLAKITARFATTKARSRRLRYGSTPTVSGRLVDERDQPISGATIAVLQRRRQAGADAIQVGSVTSADDGRFAYKLAPGPSRVVTFAYSAFVGDPKPATTSSLRTSVRAIVTARITPRSVLAGRTITLSGKLRLLPREGIDVKIQARDGRQWRFIGEVKTKRGGSFRWRYRFKASAAGRMFAFRTRVASPIYPFATSNSKPMYVRVR